MNIRAKKIFNFRPLCLIALGLIAGIVTGELIAGENYVYLIIPFCAAAAAILALSFKKKARKFLIIPLAFVVGVVGITISDYMYIRRQFSKGYTGEMTMTVDSELVTEDGTLKFYVEDIFINGGRLKLGGYVNYELGEDDFSADFDAGDVIYVYGWIAPNKYEKFNSKATAFRAKGRSYLIIPYHISKSSDGKPDFMTSLRLRIKGGFDRELDKETAALCKALVLGDRFGMQDSLVEDINASGLAHAFAVSGLHVTTLSVALYFLLKKLKVKPAIAFAVVSAFTFLYVWICGFTSSALRAFIMSGVFNFADTFGNRKKDSLSTLSLAAVLILLFRPYALYDMGFLMSFSSLLGIILFEKPISGFCIRMWTKALFGHDADAVSIYGGALVSLGGLDYQNVNALSKLPSYKRTNSNEKYSEKSYKRRATALRALTKLSHMTAVSVSASMLSSPYIALAFERVPTLFVLSNIVMLPYLIAVYVVLLALTIFACATGLSAALIPLQALFVPFRIYIKLLGELSFSLMPAYIYGPQLVFISLIFLLLSNQILMPRQTKAKCLPVLLSLAIVITFASFL